MVFTPTRGDAPARFGPDVPMIPDIGTGILDASVYTDPERYQRERAAVLAPSWQVICRSAEIAKPGDFLTWAGQGETIVVTRRRDGGVSGFHNVCQHRGARIVKEPSGCARRFSCRWHNWVYDLQGAVVGVPDREDFDPAALAGLAAPAVECAEWGGWVWAVLAGPGTAPPLLDWLGPEIVSDLGVYRMQDMQLAGKLTWDVPVNWKVIVDAFNENYHAAHLHAKAPPRIREDGRGFSLILCSTAMMGDPVQGRAAPAARDPRPSGHRDLPLHRLPDRGVQLQSHAHPAVPRGAAGGGPQPVRVLGTAVPHRRPGPSGLGPQRALGPAAAGRRRGRRDLGRGCRHPRLVGLPLATS